MLKDRLDNSEQLIFNLKIARQYGVSEYFEILFNRILNEARADIVKVGAKTNSWQFPALMINSFYTDFAVESLDSLDQYIIAAFLQESSSEPQNIRDLMAEITARDFVSFEWDEYHDLYQITVTLETAAQHELAKARIGKLVQTQASELPDQPQGANKEFTEMMDVADRLVSDHRRESRAITEHKREAREAGIKMFKAKLDIFDLENLQTPAANNDFKAANIFDGLAG